MPPLGRKPDRLKRLVVANVVAVVAVVVGSASVDGFGRGVHVWLPCVAMLLGWLAVTPTKTVRWVSVLRLFSISALWALVIGAVSMKLARSLDLAVRDPGPSIGTAAMVEETLKLAPLGADLVEVILDDALRVGADLGRVVLAGSSLVRAKLEGARLQTSTTSAPGTPASGPPTLCGASSTVPIFGEPYSTGRRC
jgi:hypothetical protein